MTPFLSYPHRVAQTTPENQYMPRLWKHGAAADDSVNCMGMLRQPTSQLTLRLCGSAAVCLVASCANADRSGQRPAK